MLCQKSKITKSNTEVENCYKTELCGEKPVQINSLMNKIYSTLYTTELPLNYFKPQQTFFFFFLLESNQVNWSIAA